MDKIGLVLGGGGAKGSYEIGVWTALRDLELESQITGVSGTSIGALNMALFAQRDLDAAQKLWMSLTTKDIVQIKPEILWKAALVAIAAASGNQSAITRVGMMVSQDFSKMDWGSIGGYFTKKRVEDIKWQASGGILSRESIQKILDAHVNPDRMLASGCTLFACCYDIQKRQAEYFSLNNREILTKMIPSLQGLVPEPKQILLASAALPSLFDAVSLNGKKYYDGGLADNLPIFPLYQAGWRKIIAVNLTPQEAVDESLFPDARLCVIAPDKSLAEKGIWGTMSFDRNMTFQRIQAGYMDAFRLLNDFPIVYEDNPYSRKESMKAANVEDAIHLNNGLDVKVHPNITVQTVGKSRYLIVELSIRMWGGPIDGDACMVLPNSCFLAFPNGYRSYINLNLSGGRLFKFPLTVTKGQWTSGKIALRLLRDAREFLLVIKDDCEHEQSGTDYYFSLTVS